MSRDGFSKSINETELAEGDTKAVRIKGKPILLTRVVGQIYTVSNLCPHAGCQLLGESSQATSPCAHATARN